MAQAPIPVTIPAVLKRVTTHCLSCSLVLLTACATTGQTTPAPTPTLPPTVTASPAPTPTPTLTPTVTPTRAPTITPPPSERDDHPDRVPPVALDPGGFLSWSGSVEALVDDQDWVAIYLAGAPGSAVTVELEMPCGGGDTARAALFDASVVAAADGDGDGRLSYDEAVESGAPLDFEMGCLQDRSATVPGGADYYVVIYAAYGGRTGYSLYLSR